MTRVVPVARIVSALAACLVPVAVVAAPATVLYNDRIVEVARTLSAPNDLWVVPEDLTQINGFVLRSNEACLNDLCVPAKNDSDLLITRSRQRWISVTELARQIRQAFAFDSDRNVWSFGEIPATRTRFLDSAIAPDFSLPNRQGKLVSLSDFRGKKVLIVTWASW